MSRARVKVKGRFRKKKFVKYLAFANYLPQRENMTNQFFLLKE